MKSSVLTKALAIAALVAFAAPSQAMADPTITEAFLANVKPNVRFLEQSSQLALAKSKSAANGTAMRTYAQGELTDAVQTAAALDDAQAIRFAAIVPADGELVTGRSVAIEPADGLGQAANGRAPLGSQDIDSLAKLSGRAFLDAFWLKQVDALSQLRADYTNYAQNGDDPALVAMAKRRLTDVEHRLALLIKL